MSAAVTYTPVRRAPLHLRTGVPPTSNRETWVGLFIIDAAAIGGALWVFRLITALALAIVPGRILLQALRVPSAAVRRYVAYLPCASLVVLVWTALTVDLAGPQLGIAKPLRFWPLLVGLNVVLVALGIAGRGAGNAYRLRSADLVGRARSLWPLCLVVASLAATARLDNGDGNALAMGVLIAVGISVVLFTVLSSRMNPQQLNVAIYAAGLSAMLLTSMRSAYVVGYDISSEYAVFHRTAAAGFWHFGHLAPYQAMLSLTVLPAMLHALIGGQDVWILKLVYPALFAFFPVAVFSFANRFVSRRAAVVAAAIVITQAYFFQQQPEIARQELALLVFGGLVGVIFDALIERRSRFAFIALLASALVVCHYSTVYVTIALFLVALLFAAVVRRRGARRVEVVPILFGLVTLASIAFFWYVPLTHSTSNITYATKTFEKSGIAFLPGRQHGESLIGAYFNGVRRPPIAPLQYQRDVASLYAKYDQFIVPLKAGEKTQYDLRASPPVDMSGRFPGLANFVANAQFLIQQGLNALGILASLVLAFRRRSGPVSRAVGFLGIAALGVLAASRLSGTLAADYNSSRLFLQCLFILAIAQAALIEVVATRLRRFWSAGSVLFVLFAMALLVSFVVNSGLKSPLVGGGRTLDLYNSGEDYSRLYVTQPEAATAKWLAASVPRERVIYADDYATLRLDQFTGMRRGIFAALTPRTIDQFAWVYASRSNTVVHRTWGDTSSGPIDIAFPSAFLDNYFNTVYSTGTTEVFHR